MAPADGSDGGWEGLHVDARGSGRFIGDARSS
jgi:hypothetical protein